MGEEKQTDIKQLKSPINKEIMNIAWPVLIELVLSSLFGMINMMMLGNIADHAYAAAAVSAVGVTNQPLFLGLAVVQKNELTVPDVTLVPSNDFVAAYRSRSTKMRVGAWAATGAAPRTCSTSAGVSADASISA